MQLSTRGRYAVMAMVDLATRQTRAASAGRSAWRRSPHARSSARRIWSSFSASCGGPGWSLRRGVRAAGIGWRVGPMPSPSPTSSRRSMSRSVRPVARKAAPAAWKSPVPRCRAVARHMICGRNLAGRSGFSWTALRWPMWWLAGCGAAPCRCVPPRAKPAAEAPAGAGGDSHAIWTPTPPSRCVPRRVPRCLRPWR